MKFDKYVLPTSNEIDSLNFINLDRAYGGSRKSLFDECALQFTELQAN